MRIGADTVLGGTGLGDSIAINGTCLTVTEIDSAGSRFSVGLSPETLRKTSLGGLGPGSPVNLERALTPESRMGGHFVQVLSFFLLRLDLYTHSMTMKYELSSKMK